eukprot:TRINITY_DN4026_c0_g4_i8.p1 TRINITY_DN4026_c0_g4~~TRINITY_DN4026_c0_g4_i8.p1  ORF type:complete len:427 (-),score=54.67 TRINITY_DN4026_c0_g4_i8:123-1403(-)
MGDTAWLLIASSMTMLIVPALAFFYGGLIRRKNLLHMMVQCFVTFAAVSVVWSLLGYGLAFGDTSGHFIGDSKYFALRHVPDQAYSEAENIPGMAFFFYQLCVCAIAPCLLLGACAERFAFFPFLIFCCIWILIVYCPVVHWLCHEDGWLRKLGVRAFGSGMAVHIAAGYSAVAVAYLIGKRKEPKAAGEKLGPQNIAYTMLGTGLLWFGWLGYSGGAGLKADGRAALAVVNTNLSAVAGGFGWSLVDYIMIRRVKATGIATGIVTGLVSMSSGAGYCPPWTSLAIGLIAGILSHLTATCTARHQLDDTLNVFACHGISGTWSAYATGFFANDDFAETGESFVRGAFYGRGSLVGYQIVGIASVAAYSLAVTFVVAFVMQRVDLLRVDEEKEEKGLDVEVYGEEGYVLSAGVRRAPVDVVCGLLLL